MDCLVQPGTMRLWNRFQMKYEREHRQREILQCRLMDLEKEVINRQQQSQLLTQLQIDIQRLHLAFDALEVKNVPSHRFDLTNFS